MRTRLTSAAAAILLAATTFVAAGPSVMAATAFTIPTVTVRPNTHWTSPAEPVPLGTTDMLVKLDRTASLNSLPATDTLSIEIDVSMDSGTTWQQVGADACSGGLNAVKVWAECDLNVDLSNYNPTSMARRIRALVSSAGTDAITTSGSITLS